MPLNGFGTWCVRTRPSRQRCAAERAVTSAPWKATLPALGGKAPASTLSSVVLPAPFGPTMPTASPSLMRQIDVVEHHKRAEALVDTRCGEDRAVWHCIHQAVPARSISRCRATSLASTGTLGSVAFSVTT